MHTATDLRLWLTVVLIALGSWIVPEACAQTFVVNTESVTDSDGQLLRDGDLGDGMCDIGDEDNPTGVCPLFAAIDEANALPGEQTIIFQSGLEAISLAALADNVFDLVRIVDRVTIDGAVSAGRLILDGAGNRDVGEFLSFSSSVGGDPTSAGSTVRNLEIINAPGGAIALRNAGNNTVQGCYIHDNRPDLALNEALRVEGTNNLIGGVEPEQRNVVSANAYGIELPGGSGTQVLGNYIGTTPDGMQADGNHTGIRIRGGTGHQIGSADAPNVISGNEEAGIFVGRTRDDDAPAQSIVIQGNYVGTDATGTRPLENNVGITTTLAGSALDVVVDGLVVGGTAAGAGNVVAGNTNSGIRIWRKAESTQVLGNYVGTNHDGDAGLGNGRRGIDVFGPNTVVGGTETGAGNVLSGNGQSGVNIGNTENTQVVGNWIGTTPGGDGSLANEGNGLFLFGTDNTEIRNNTIAHNAGSGVRVLSGIGNRISENAIFDNGGLGIDLDEDGDGGTEDGVTSNDPMDADEGANGLQNFPLVQATRNGDTVVGGTLDSRPETTYRIEFFSNPTGAAEPFQGKTFLGSTTVTTDGEGHAAFSETFQGTRQNVTAAATDPDGNTSEFSSGGIQLVADLFITKASNVSIFDTLAVGDSLRYVLSIGNDGPDRASGVTVSDPLPDGIDLTGPPEIFPGSNASGTECQFDTATRTVTCTIDALNPTTATTEVTIRIPVVVNPGASGTLRNAASVTASTPEDPLPANNADTLSQMVEAERAVSRANTPAAGSGSDPVSTFTGELYVAEPPDLALGGPLPVRFQRYYASLLARDERLETRLGPNWTHTFAWKLNRVDETRLEVVTCAGRALLFNYDGDAWQQANLPQRPYQLLEEGESVILVNPRTAGIYVFDADRKLVQIEDGRGRTLALSYDADGRLETVGDGLGRMLTFAYDGDRIASVSDGTRAVTFGYSEGQLSSATDPLGNTITYSYTGTSGFSALLTAKTLPDGNARFTQTYDAEGRVSSQTDAAGNTTTFAYSVAETTGERITTLTDPLGHTTQHVHDASGRLLSLADAGGQTIDFGYDDVGQRDRTTDRMGGITRSSYDPVSGLPTAVTEAHGATTQITHTPSTTGAGVVRYDRTAIDLADGGSVSIRYGDDGNPTSITDPAGGTWSFTYDSRSQPLTATNPEGGTTTFSYNADGTLASVADPAGNTTTCAYDGLRRLTSVTRPDGTTRTYSYDDVDRITAVTDEEGRTYAFSYDANGNLTAITDPAGKTLQGSYDAMDRLASVTDRQGQTTAYTYDALGRLTAVTGPAGRTTTFGYDTESRLTSIADGEGQTWTISYDAEGVPTALTDPEGEATSFGANGMGWITQVTSPLGNTTSLTYDSMGRVATVQDPSGGTTTLSRDARGLLDGMTVPGGASASLARDGLGFVEEYIGPGGGSWQTPRDALGRVTGRIDPLGRSAARTYDSRHRVVEVTQPGGLGTVTLAYDGTNRLTGQVHSGGPGLSYSYDGLGRLTEATGVTLTRDDEGRITESNGLAVTRGDGGRVTSVALPGGTVAYRYDGAGRLTEVEDWQGGITTFSYDGAGRLVQLTRPNGRATTYSYDGTGRLTGIEETDGDGATLASSTVTRDARGNVTKAERSAPLAPELAPETVTHSYDAVGQVEAFSYDALGRRTDDGVRTYTWDGLSRLASYEDGTGSVDFTYDGFGHRLTRETGRTTRSYVWNYALRLPSVAVEREDGADRRYYMHTPDGRLLYSIDAADGSRRYYHYDELGNTTLLTGEEGTVVAAYAYRPYGTVVAEQGGVDNPFTWQGQFGVRAEGNGLYYMRARYYDARTRRFLSRDPVRSLRPDEINPYQYARANPRRFVDPTGLLHGEYESAPPDANLIEDADFSVVVNGHTVSGQLGEFLLAAALSGQSDFVDRVVEGEPFIAGGIPVKLSSDGEFVFAGGAIQNGTERPPVSGSARFPHGLQFPPQVRRTMEHLGINGPAGRSGRKLETEALRRVFRESPATADDDLLYYFLFYTTGLSDGLGRGGGMERIVPPSNREARAKHPEDCRVLDFQDFGALVRC